MVKTGGEDKFKKKAEEKFLDAGYKAGFYFFRKQMHARSGTEFDEPLFPGYVFMETEQLENSNIELLKKLNGFYHFLFDNANPQKLNGTDLEYYQAFRKNGELLGLSKVHFDENQRIVITSGPLKGFEGNIIRVNRRCKRVTVEITLLGTSKKVDLCYSDAEVL